MSMAPTQASEQCVELQLVQMKAKALGIVSYNNHIISSSTTVSAVKGSQTN